jgi:glycosyltransferase involved in cell wall biosynthesis
LDLAYDLRYATDHFPGIGTHAHSLAAALLERENLGSVTLLWDPRARNTRFDLEPLRSHPRARWIDVDIPAMAPETARATGRLLSSLGVDMFLSPFWLKPEGTRVPSVLTLHDVIPLALPRLTSWTRRVAYRWAMRRAATATAVLTSSRFSRDEILRLTAISDARLRVLPLGVTRPRVPPVRPPGAPDGPFALTVGAHRPHKGLDTLAAVWREFAGRAPLTWVVTGADSPGPGSFAELTRDVPDVRSLGQVPPDALEWLYHNATLVLMPSRYEGFGLPMLEAAMRGAAIVASDLPPLREIGEGVARFVPPGDGVEWARAIRELSSDEATRRGMGAAGPVRAAEYDYARYASHVEQLLHDSLAGVPA